MSCQDTILNLYFLFLIPIFVYEFYYRDPTLMFLPKMTISYILIGVILWYFSSNDNTVNYNYGGIQYDKKILNTLNNTNNNYKNNRYYCYQTDEKTYDKITKINTKKELEKLTKTPQFKKMYEEKGDNFENWNWQSRERLQGIEQLSESQIGSEDIENMSIS